VPCRAWPDVVVCRVPQVGGSAPIASENRGYSDPNIWGEPERSLARCRPGTRTSHGVSYLRYWVDEATGKTFCLLDAGSAEDANIVHAQAHGLVADGIYTLGEYSWKREDNENPRSLQDPDLGGIDAGGDATVRHVGALRGEVQGQ